MWLDHCSPLFLVLCEATARVKKNNPGLQIEHLGRCSTFGHGSEMGTPPLKCPWKISSNGAKRNF